jgi:hypothetical protein
MKIGRGELHSGYEPARKELRQKKKVARRNWRS